MRQIGFLPPDELPDDRNPEAFAYEMMLRIALRCLAGSELQAIRELFVELRERLIAGGEQARLAPRATEDVIDEWHTMVETVKKVVDELDR